MITFHQDKLLDYYIIINIIIIFWDNARTPPYVQLLAPSLKTELNCWIEVTDHSQINMSF